MRRHDAFYAKKVGRGCQENTENNPENSIHLELGTPISFSVAEVKNANRIAGEAAMR